LRSDREDILKHKYILKSYLSPSLPTSIPTRQELLAVCEKNDYVEYLKLVARGLSLTTIEKAWLGWRISQKKNLSRRKLVHSMITPAPHLLNEFSITADMCSSHGSEVTLSTKQTQLTQRESSTVLEGTEQDEHRAFVIGKARGNSRDSLYRLSSTRRFAQVVKEKGEIDNEEGKKIEEKLKIKRAELMTTKRHHSSLDLNKSRAENRDLQNNVDTTERNQQEEEKGNHEKKRRGITKKSEERLLRRNTLTHEMKRIHKKEFDNLMKEDLKNSRKDIEGKVERKSRRSERAKKNEKYNDESSQKTIELNDIISDTLIVPKISFLENEDRKISEENNSQISSQTTNENDNQIITDGLQLLIEKNTEKVVCESQEDISNIIDESETKSPPQPAIIMITETSDRMSTGLSPLTTIKSTPPTSTLLMKATTPTTPILPTPSTPVVSNPITTGIQNNSTSFPVAGPLKPTPILVELLKNGGVGPIMLELLLQGGLPLNLGNNDSEGHDEGDENGWNILHHCVNLNR
jgi:hypothetical protein